ncbi:nonribosomal peptide synthetase MxcG [Streptoalloteichus tenebrarius]|uniref:Nonribosomal peptide synthetase MxcG n=1 Tax=Streptoalloteichus tenebrarius (strain ATCC 17920 / DSM 40477 / JCM 4838 / CBS 697.72 / NBRC 16177 / NCIMB 11028 / NRRL B-12390 / A12253. 1 / ISP 5477) TaxID=1933 RepID=A0ABT1I0Q5_STRSD|nr:amino acid adenylation domain-containing protein [Streptoalloteichus tenebrarius]MCP2261200.1 nonribosomal peptide synthetase MxcG [Streptoalloteichus tenebrarius]BFF02938.1 hypothetical protein GCM10020241_46130 [Streptoalloteichus tenebrarius]
MPLPSDARWPLSAAQAGIWSGQRLDQDSPVYNAAEYVEIHGPVDHRVFEAAVRVAVAEAEALHVRFDADAEGPWQTPGPVPDWDFPVVDLSGEPDPASAAEAWMRADLARAVDLTRGPLFAQALLRMAPDRFRWYQRVHHIALDGFGHSLLARRVAEVYTALATGAPVPPSGFGSLSSVVAEDVEYRASEQFQRDRDFWSERFADRPEVVGFTERVAPMSSWALRSGTTIGKSTMDAVGAVARLGRTTWPEVLLAVVAGHLARATGAGEVVLGLPVMGRMGSAALRVPCMAMNIVPLRVPVAPDASLLDLVRAVSSELRRIRPHQRYRYEDLKRDLRLIGGDRRLFGPVVNIMPFDYDLRFAGHRGTAHNVSAGPVEDLSIAVHHRCDGSGPQVEFDANPALYTEDDLAAHQRTFLALLDALTARPDTPLSDVDIPLAGPADGAAVSVLDGGPLPATPTDVTDLIGRWAERRPDAVAVEHGDTRVTYGELVGRARGLAARLVASGAGPDLPVAVMLPRGVDAVVAFLGVLFAGAGYLPLDPHGPRNRASTVLADAGPRLLVTTADHAASVPEDAACQVVLLDGRSADRPGDADALPTPASEWPAYVIYTSGSTGQPNGVVVSRGALAHFVAGASHRYGVRGDDRVLQFAPLHFDASVEEIYLTLCAGATLVVRTEEMLESVPDFLTACAERAVTVLDLPTAFWHEVAYSVSTGAATVPPSVRAVIIGGEAALPERVARWRASVAPEVQLLNTYGPTEATVVATVATLSGHGPVGEEVPIGRPLPGVVAAVVGRHGRPVALGETGELCLLGGGLATGYLGRPELDDTRFAALAALPGRPRAYRTGDLVRCRPGGDLVFVGRVDDEFKISGHRVDPTEVETVLLGHPAVREAAVVGHVLPGGVKRLSAHVVLAEGADGDAPTPAELRAHLRASLPAAVVPSAVAVVDRLPRTSSGKIDRKALRARGFPAENDTAADATNATNASVAVASGTERVVLRVWREVLGVPGLSLQDDFFELGGQSLQAIQVANRLGVELGQPVPVATLFRHPTVAALAEALDQERGLVGDGGGLPPLAVGDAVLGEDVVPSTVTPVRVTRPRQVLLTGATGFVGAHLLHELLTQTDARVVCLVRAEDAASAERRVRAALTRQHLPLTDVADRVVALPADLTRPWLGLDAERFAELAEECDAIYHNAAVVSVVREYRSLRAANVLGTREILRLAAAGRPVPVHHVSTLAVGPPEGVSPEVPEAFVPAHPGLADGYQQSKWVAERLMEQAAHRGLPVTVYRLGRVVGAPGTGLVNEQDLVWRLLLPGIRAGALPVLDVAETWTPVDFVARALVRLSLTGTPEPGRVFNVAPVPPVRLTDLAGWVRDYGYAVDELDVPTWCARVAEGADAENLATMVFFDLRADGGGSAPAFRLGPVRSDDLRHALAGTGIECPVADRALLHRYLDHCVGAGLLPAPDPSRV